MKVSEVMANITPDPKFTGPITNDDMLLAIDITGKATNVDDYEVIQGAVGSVDAQLSAESDTKNYIREGKSTTKTSTQRTFSVSGDRFPGVPFQDFCFSHAIKFGTGATVVRPYVWLCMRNGMGEKGTASIIVNSDAGGDAGASAEFDVDIQATSIPEEFVYGETESEEEEVKV